MNNVRNRAKAPGNITQCGGGIRERGAGRGAGGGGAAATDGGRHARGLTLPEHSGRDRDFAGSVNFTPPSTSCGADSLGFQHEGGPSPAPAALLLPHDGSHVCCLPCAAQLNIANPSTGKQKLIDHLRTARRGIPNKTLALAAFPRRAARRDERLLDGARQAAHAVERWSRPPLRLRRPRRLRWSRSFSWALESSWGSAVPS